MSFLSLNDIWVAVAIGLLGGSSFGPVNLTILTLHLSRKTGKAIYMSCGALIGDLLIVITGREIANLLSNYLGGKILLLAATFFLFFFSIKVVLVVPKSKTIKFHHASSSGAPIYIAYGLVFSYLNPVGFMLWNGLTIAGFSSSLSSASIIYIFLGNVIWFVFFNAALFKLSFLFSERNKRIIARVSAFGVMVFSMIGIYRLLTG